jgi:N-acetylmuramic acid 6-phosphate etherase
MKKRRLTFHIAKYLLCLMLFGLIPKAFAKHKGSETILELLRIEPSKESRDYVYNHKQFQLHNLITEQRHPTTWDLSEAVNKSTEEGLTQLLLVDQDITQKIRKLAKNSEQIQQASKAVEEAILQNNKIYNTGVVLLEDSLNK